MVRKKTSQEYYDECKKNELDLPIEPYVNNKTKIKHLCSKCGNVYLQSPGHHLEGMGCKRCAIEYTASLTRVSKTKYEYENYCKKHGYDLPLSGFDKTSDYIKFKCSSCGRIYTQRVNSHNLGCSCQVCANKKSNRCRNSLETRKSYEQYIEECKQKRLDLPIEVYVKGNIKINHKCNKCGFVYKQEPTVHLQGHGCPICSQSHGEKFIQNYLDKHNIIYESQKTFNDLKDKTYLSYDFYLPKQKVLIEYQGIQHFKSVSFDGKVSSDLEKQQYHDKLKREYATNKGYTLLEPTYKLSTQDKVNKYLYRNIRW